MKIFLPVYATFDYMAGQPFCRRRANRRALHALRQMKSDRPRRAVAVRVTHSPMAHRVTVYAKP